MANLFKLEAGKYNALMGKLAEAGLTAEHAQAILDDREGSAARAMVAALAQKPEGQRAAEWQRPSIATLFAQREIMRYDSSKLTDDRFTVDRSPAPSNRVRTLHLRNGQSSQEVFALCDGVKRRFATLTEVALSSHASHYKYLTVIALGSIWKDDAERFWAPEFAFGGENEQYHQRDRREKITSVRRIELVDVTPASRPWISRTRHPDDPKTCVAYVTL